MLDMYRNYDLNCVDLLSKLGSSIRGRRYDLQTSVSLGFLISIRYEHTTMRSSHVGEVFKTDHAVQLADPADLVALLTLLSNQCLTLFGKYIVVRTQLFDLVFVRIIKLYRSGSRIQTTLSCRWRRPRIRGVSTFARSGGGRC